MPSVKNHISERSLNPETLIEVENIKENSKKLIKEKQSTRDAKARPVLQNFKQYKHLEMLLNNRVVTMNIENDEKDHLSKKIGEFTDNTR